MMGRAAYQEPWRLLAVDPLLFGEPAPFASPKAAALALIPYIERELARGARLHAITRHLHGLFHGGAGRARLPPASGDRGGQARRMRRGSGRGAGAGGGQARRTGANRRSWPSDACRAEQLMHARGAARRDRAGSPPRSSSAASSTGILAGLFGIGGGAIIVPVLYEVFRILGVPEEVRMQLCVGTSMAIIVPTTIRSYLTHRAKGAVLIDVVRAWAVPAVVGVAVGSVIADFRAERGVQDRVRGDRRRSSRSSFCSAATAGGSPTSCPAAPAMTGYGFLIGLCVVADGRERRLGLQHDPDALRQADAQRGRDLGRPRRADHDRRHDRLHARGLAAAGAAAAVLDRLRSLLGVALMAPVSSFTAPYGARLAQRLPRRSSKIALRAVSCCWCRCGFSSSLVHLSSHG